MRRLMALALVSAASASAPAWAAEESPVMFDPSAQALTPVRIVVPE